MTSGHDMYFGLDAPDGEASATPSRRRWLRAVFVAAIRDRGHVVRWLLVELRIVRRAPRQRTEQDRQFCQQVGFRKTARAGDWRKVRLLDLQEMAWARALERAERAAIGRALSKGLL